MYFGWFEDAPKVNIQRRVQDAADAYARRFGVRANIVLMNEADYAALNGVEITGIAVRVAPWIRKNNYWAGKE